MYISYRKTIFIYWLKRYIKYRKNLKRKEWNDKEITFAAHKVKLCFKSVVK